MAIMLRSTRLAAGACEHWKATKPRALEWRPHKLPSCAVALPIFFWRRPICVATRAASSDFGDPERLTGEDYYPDSRYPDSSYTYSSGGSDSEGDSFSQSPGSLGDKLNAASQLSESVPSAAVDPLEEDGGDDGNSGAHGGGDSGGNDKSGNADNSDFGDNKKKLSASQKLTLAYAILVGVGGAIGYAKSRSVKSLISGAVSTVVLFYVYTQLPTNPVLASSIGLGISALLLGVMGTRFTKSRRLFPAGVVAFVSLVMTGGYIHGIIRGAHA